ncbi:MAG: transaldolase family protein, partial [Lysobacter sp.]
MSGSAYLSWVIEQTPTRWWHDSAESAELDLALARGAIGVSTNPVLASAALQKHRGLWREAIDRALAQHLSPERKAEELMRIVVTHAAEKLLPRFGESNGQAGFVCAQVNPMRAGDRAAMYP